MNFSSVSRRFWALIFDYFIIGSIFYGVVLVLKMSGISIFQLKEVVDGDFSSLSNFYLLYIIIYLIYEVTFLSSNLSATPGKIIMEMEVVSANANFFKVFFRSLIKAISTLTGLHIIFFTIAVFTEKSQALHDLLTGSFVIDKEMTSSSAMDLTKDITKTDAFYEEMKKRGIKTPSEKKALAEEMFSKAKKNSTNSILSNSFIWILVLFFSIGFVVIEGKVFVSDLIIELSTIPQYRDNGIIVDQSIAEKYVGTWANDKKTVGFTVYYLKKTGTMYINTSKEALIFMFDSDNVLYITEGENKYKVKFSSDSYNTIHMTGTINSQLEYTVLLHKQ